MAVCVVFVKKNAKDMVMVLWVIEIFGDGVMARNIMLLACLSEMVLSRNF